jgi:Major Facilitator Superfamily
MPASQAMLNSQR